MLNRRNYKTISIRLLAIGLVILSGCERRTANYPDSMPDDFNFISSIANNSYILDTYKDKLTKTIDWELDTTISYQLPVSEKQEIYKI